METPPAPTSEDISALAHRFYGEEGYAEGQAEAHWSPAEPELVGRTTSENESAGGSDDETGA